MMDRPQPQRACRVCRNPLCFVPCIVIFLTVGSLLVYTLIGVQQCFDPVDGLETKPCSEVAEYLHNVSKSSEGKHTERIFVHQHNIALNLSNLVYFSRVKWEQSFNYMFHNKSMCRGLIAEYYPQILELYDSYPDDIQRADVSRVAILHHYGGIYSDLDAFPKKACKELANVYADTLTSAYFPTGNGDVFVNHFFITNKNNSFLGYLLESFELFSNRWKWIPLPYLRVFLTTGPCAVTMALRNWEQMWKSKGVTPAPSVMRMKGSECLVRHEAGRQWLSIDGIFFNWIGDNAAFFVYSLVSFSVIVVVVLLFVRIKRRFRPPPVVVIEHVEDP